MNFIDVINSDIFMSYQKTNHPNLFIFILRETLLESASEWVVKLNGCIFIYCSCKFFDLYSKSLQSIIGRKTLCLEYCIIKQVIHNWVLKPPYTLFRVRYKNNRRENRSIILKYSNIQNICYFGCIKLYLSLMLAMFLDLPKGLGNNQTEKMTDGCIMSNNYIFPLANETLNHAYILQWISHVCKSAPWLRNSSTKKQLLF